MSGRVRLPSSRRGKWRLGFGLHRLLMRQKGVVHPEASHQLFGIGKGEEQRDSRQVPGDVPPGEWALFRTKTEVWLVRSRAEQGAELIPVQHNRQRRSEEWRDLEEAVGMLL